MIAEPVQAVYNNQTASHTMRIMRTIVDKKEAFLVCIANDKKTANDLLQEVKDKDRKRNEGLKSWKCSVIRNMAVFRICLMPRP